jgi:hypothetical protein
MGRIDAAPFLDPRKSYEDLVVDGIRGGLDTRPRQTKPGEPEWEPAPPAEGNITRMKGHSEALQASELKHDLPRGVLHALGIMESGFDPEQAEGFNSSGAGGLMQIIEQIHKSRPADHPRGPYDGIDDVHNNADAIDYSGRYLKRTMTNLGNIKKGLAGYNWGPSNVNRQGMENMPSETKHYVESIMSMIKPDGKRDVKFLDKNDITLDSGAAGFLNGR